MSKRQSPYLFAAVAILIVFASMFFDLSRGQNFPPYRVILPEDGAFSSSADGATIEAMNWLQGRPGNFPDICQFSRDLQDLATDRRDAILALETLKDMDVIDVTETAEALIVSPGKLNKSASSAIIKGITNREWRSCRAPFIDFYLAGIIAVLVATALALLLFSRTRQGS